MEPHERIIHQLCRESLTPIGVFQRGTSRVYIDDNGYFFTVIEFQPSGSAKGTYLNVALHFLWNEQDYISYDFPFGSPRVKDFIEYQNDAQFTQAVRSYIETALDQIHFYRKLCHMDTAKKWMQKYRKHPYAGKLAPMEQLDDPQVLERIKRTRAFWHSKPAMKKMKHYPAYDG